MADQPTTPQDTAQNQTPEETGQNGRAWYFWPLAGLIAVVAVFVIGLLMALIFAVVGDSGDAANWIGIIRDLFIIVLAMEGMIMGIALIVLIVQLAALVNLLQNEIQPIVDNANETVTTVRGTAQFMSQNLVEPVIKFSALTAALGGLVREALGIRRTLRQASSSETDSKQETKQG
ncbi:MAG: hypothetical protein JXJ20_10665 [Anaerolineae bacterium]|nr:hypothetical protein [Anaerolineae bacterium]